MGGWIAQITGKALKDKESILSQNVTWLTDLGFLHTKGLRKEDSWHFESPLESFRPGFFQGSMICLPQILRSSEYKLSSLYEIEFSVLNHIKGMNCPY